MAQRTEWVREGGWESLECPCPREASWSPGHQVEQLLKSVFNLATGLSWISHVHLCGADQPLGFSFAERLGSVASLSVSHPGSEFLPGEQVHLPAQSELEPLLLVSGSGETGYPLRATQNNLECFFNWSFSVTNLQQGWESAGLG